VARQCAEEKADFPRYLLRLTELELLDRDAGPPSAASARPSSPWSRPSILSTSWLSHRPTRRCAGSGSVRVPRAQGDRVAARQQWNRKTHLSLALGLAACQRGHRVRFTTASALVSELIEARDEKHLLRCQKLLAGYELLIVDELGFVPCPRPAPSCSSRPSASAMNAPPHW